MKISEIISKFINIIFIILFYNIISFFLSYFPISEKVIPTLSIAIIAILSNLAGELIKKIFSHFIQTSIVIKAKFQSISLYKDQNGKSNLDVTENDFEDPDINANISLKPKSKLFYRIFKLLKFRIKISESSELSTFSINTKNTDTTSKVTRSSKGILIRPFNLKIKNSDLNLKKNIQSNFKLHPVYAGLTETDLNMGMFFYLFWIIPIEVPKIFMKNINIKYDSIKLKFKK